jgi:hypothetical protein
MEIPRAGFELVNLTPDLEAIDVRAFLQYAYQAVDVAGRSPNRLW